MQQNDEHETAAVTPETAAGYAFTLAIAEASRKGEISHDLGRKLVERGGELADALFDGKMVGLDPDGNISIEDAEDIEDAIEAIDTSKLISPIQALEELIESDGKDRDLTDEEFPIALRHPSSRPTLMSCSFHWASTPQGRDYWAAARDNEQVPEDGMDTLRDILASYKKQDEEVLEVGGVE